MNSFNTPFDEGENFADEIADNTADTNADKSADNKSARSADKQSARRADKEEVEDEPLHVLQVPNKWSH